jgi:hypothetical protein
VAAELEEALERCADIAALSAPPPGESPSLKKDKPKKKVVKKAPAPRRLPAAPAELSPPKPLVRLAKPFLLCCLVLRAGV